MRPMKASVAGRLAIAFCVVVGLAETATRAANQLEPVSERTLTIVVMDPLAAPLSCPCVKGYAQRDYQQLANFLSEKMGVNAQVVFNESLTKALKEKTKGKADLIIGKDSVVRFDAKRSKLKLQPIAMLSGKEGETTQKGLIVVRGTDPAQSLGDLKGYRILFGPKHCEEKFGAARKVLQAAGVELAEKPEISEACSDGACQIIEWGKDVRAATVISSYAKPLLEGCGTIEKGDLRVVAETAPVPFITAFVNKKLPEAEKKQIKEALAQVASDRELCKSLESLLGFLPAQPKEKKEQGVTQSATESPATPG